MNADEQPRLPTDEPQPGAGPQEDGSTKARADAKDPAATDGDVKSDQSPAKTKPRAKRKAAKEIDSVPEPETETEQEIDETRPETESRSDETPPASALSARTYVSQSAAELAGSNRAGADADVRTVEIKPGYWKWWVGSGRRSA